MEGYKQFCPIALTSELFAERWTPLIIREIHSGGSRFNDIHRGIPLMSRAIFARRLKSLVDRGLIEHGDTPETAREYRLTPGGLELWPILDAMGVWGQRWIRELRDEDLDVGYLMWNMRRRIHRDRLPPGRTIVRFDFTDAPQAKRVFWLLLQSDEVDLCLTNTGFEVDLVVETDVRTMVEVWRGLVPYASATREKRLRLEGRRELVRAFPSWLKLSHFAHVERPVLPKGG